METSQGRFKWTYGKAINLIKCLQELNGSYAKFSFLNIDSFQWLQGFEVIIVISHLQNYKFQVFVAAIFVLICFWHAFSFTFLIYIKLSIYSRLLYFNPGLNFSYNCNFFSTRLDNCQIQVAY